MASDEEEAQPRGSVEFVESSVLEAIVPSDTDTNIEEELTSWDGSPEENNGSILSSISPRQVLLFDELVPVYVVFRTPPIERVTLESYLSRLAITLEGFVFSSAPSPEPEAKAPPPKELIYSDTIKPSSQPLIIHHEEDGHPHIYVVWKVEVFICRPRGRFHKPFIYFQPAASLKPAERAKKNVLDDEYLPSKVPTALNLLQSFENDPALEGAHPRLSALRIGKIVPTAPVAKELVRPIRSGQRRLFRALPAIIWRMRYSKMQSSLSDASLIASLDLEAAYITGCTISIQDVKLSLRGGRVDSIADHKYSSTVYKPGDQITYLYRLTLDLAPDGTPIFETEGHIVDLKVKATVLISEGCRPNILINWRTAVDFTIDHNPSLMKVAHRLSNPTLQPMAKIPDPDSLPIPETQSQQEDDTQNKIINVTLTISGPPRVQVGEIFHWNIFIVNRSDKTRKLAILVIPKRKREVEKHKSHPSASSVGTQKGKKDVLASAVVDENVVYAKQKQARIEPAELICLTTDVRIGHLAPGACYTADLKFQALSSGVLSVDAVRVIDLATQEAANIHELPSIVAIEKEG
ncbi:hypothetical protein CC78DRAFT_495885 [Lojkania enalia]|uniref:Trafficking protein particle complex II-specific subunit 65 IgD3 domain-containing protein n=1 Tax=Lojkania enalia TaxID=147567 RepID=A0A9P4K9Z4_9PLEO|nr:hypothetical protein CC78DRAFT_495885 [Didymosphaeria enalia]